jgi:hypothetical protein
VAYSVAARQLEAAGLRPGETLASHGRTLYPPGDARTGEQRRRDTHRAALIPDGRAHHLTERFPPARGRRGSRVGLLYHGEGRAELLSLVYLAVAVRSPALLPQVGDLAWVAEMGEESAVDLECAGLDREARALLESDPAEVRALIDQALSRAADSRDWRLRSAASRLSVPADPPFEGARQILDALLVVANDGHAPATRVRMLTSPWENRTATVVGAVWGAPGPPVAYRVRVEGVGAVVAAAPGELIVLAGQ